MTTATQVQLRRGTAAQNAAFTGAAGELVADTTNNRTILHNGSTAGGFPQASEAYVQAQLGSLAAGAASNFANWLFCH